MNRHRFFKRFSALVLMTILLISGIGFNAFGTDTAYSYVYETESNFDDPMVYPEAEISGDGMSFFSDLPEISEEREVEWIDRIHNKPQYAVDFYDWLITNSEKNGALVTAKEDCIDEENNVFAHNVTTYADTVNFNFTPGISEDEIKTIARGLVDDTIDENFYVSAEWIVEVYSAFDRDFPEVFWLSGGTVVAYESSYRIGYDRNYGVGLVQYTQNIYFYLSSNDFDIRSTAYPTESSIVTAISERDAAIKKIVNACTATDDYGKVKYINNYLTKNNCYNKYAETTNYSPVAHRCVSALQSKTGIYAPVCDGYAKAFKVLCDKMKIPCVLVDGITDDKSHMWNYVELDGNWYAVDTTWNDPVTSSAALNSGYENEKYFLIGSETVVDGVRFADSHIVHNTVIDSGISFINGPLLSKATYNSTVSHTCTLENGYCTFCYAKRYDVNRDTEVNMVDLISLQKILLNNDSNGNSDCDINGSINSADLIVLKKYFWDIF